jgi:metal-responsive CopG/Arc/MetJ family transcriptional regulator
MSKRINVILPDETLHLLNRVTTAGARSLFISRAILHYFETQGRKSLREKLKAGYKANLERDLAIAADWFPLEEEASAKPERSSVVKRKIAKRK